jgi:putative aldouronate transport system substrate-binding protein
MVTGFVFALLGMAACGKSGTAAPPGAASADITLPGGWKPTTDLSKPIRFSYATVNVREGTNTTDGDDWARWYSGNFNIEQDLTVLTFDNWSERIRLWVSSGDMPDIALFDYQHTDAANWVEQGLLKQLPQGWKSRWPNLAAQYEVTSLGPELERRFGGTYFIPRPRFSKNLPGIPVPNHLSFYYRKDWAEAAGFPVKDAYTISELIEYGRLIKEKDPGQLGNKLIPISARPEWAMRFFIASNSTHYNTFYKDKDGLYKWGAAAKDTLEGLKLYYRAYSQGILNPEFYTLKSGDDYNHFYTSFNAASIYGEAPTLNLWIFSELYFAANSGLPRETVGWATVLGEDGYYHQEDLINYWGCLMFNPDMGDEKFFRLLDMLDWACTDIGFANQNLGLYKTDWDYDGAGNFVNLLEGQLNENGSAITAMDKYPAMSAIPPIVRLFDDFAFDSPTVDEYFRSESRKLYADRVRMSSPETFTNIDWDLWCYDSPVMRRAKAFQFDQEYANLVTRAKSEADLETLWNQWIQQNAPLIQPALDELNTKLK